MSKFGTALKLIKNPGVFIIGLDYNGLTKWIPDDLFARISFRGMMGEKLHLKNPVTFNEKLQWLKVYDHKPEYTALVDKLSAKKEVGKLIGKEYIVPVYGIWKRADEIDFDKLPERFVLKCNHDQGSVVLIRNKENMDRDAVIKDLNRKLKRNAYYGTREYPYKNIKPRVFAEEYLDNNIIDYKFYCFNGEPKFLYCGQGLTEDHSLKIDFYDLNWKLMPFYRTDYHRLGQIPKPSHFEEMVHIAKNLSAKVPFVRIDLFEVNDRVYFSEFTLCPASGFMPFVPKEYDKIVGNWLHLPT